MKILDRYILGTLLTSFVICLIGVMSLYILIDGFDRLEEFSEYVTESGKGSVGGLFLRYYLVRTPLIFIQIGPVIMLLASMFSMTRMVRHNELIPLFSSGISIYRVVRLHMIVGAVCALGMMAIQEWVLPRFASEIEQSKVFEEGDKRKLVGVQMFDKYGRVFYFTEIHPHESKVFLVRVLERDSTGRRSREIVANRGTWVQVDDELQLILTEFEERRFKPGSLEFEQGYPRKAKDAKEELPIRTDIKVADMFRTKKVDVEFAATRRELVKKLENDPKRHELKLSLHLRVSLPIATLILLLLGLPLVVTRETKNFFLGVGICILIASAFYLCLFVCINLGNKAVLTPGFAAWFPLALFGSLGVAMMDGIKT